MARFSIAFALLILIYFAAAFCLSRITINPHPVNKKEIAIYIMSNGIHTDLVVPAVTPQIDWTQEIKYSHTVHANPAYKFLAIGWGDKKFYLETPTFSDLKVGTALNAISGFSSAAIHTTYYQHLIEDSNCKKIMISHEQYVKLVNYIINSFQTDPAGHFIKVDTKIHYDYGDAFYQANGHYSIFKTCNTWTNNALKACGQRSCFWTIFDTGLLKKYE